MSEEETPDEILEQFDLTEIEMEEELEGAKLEATVIGNLAIATGTAGILTPVVSVVLGIDKASTGTLLTVVGVCLVAAIMLYVVAVNMISVVYRRRKLEKGASNG